MRADIRIYRKKRGLLWDKEQERVIRRCARAVLLEEGFSYPAEAAVSLTDDEGIREINGVHRGVDKATDVLSFPMFLFYNGRPNEDLSSVVKAEGFVFLGDIVLSVERARVQAEEYGHSLLRELGFLTVHSMLHLLGYDHERGDGDLALMREKEEQILSGLCLLR